MSGDLEVARFRNWMEGESFVDMKSMREAAVLGIPMEVIFSVAFVGIIGLLKSVVRFEGKSGSFCSTCPNRIEVRN